MEWYYVWWRLINAITKTNRWTALISNLHYYLHDILPKIVLAIYLEFYCYLAAKFIAFDINCRKTLGNRDLGTSGQQRNPKFLHF